MLRLKQAGAVLALIVFALLIVGFVAAAPTLRMTPIGAGYSAKALCSGVFLSERDVADVIAVDLAFVPMMSERSVTVDRGARTVDARLGFETARAIYRENCGCTLVVDGATEEALRSQAPTQAFPRPELNPSALWPEGSDTEPSAKASALDDAFAYAFDEPFADLVRGTRALIVVENGRIIREEYAPGFHGNMPLTSWSMTKTVTATLVGILVGDGLLNVHASAPVGAWSSPSDPRDAITLDQLLRMSSSLKFDEDYSPDGPADVSIMLYEKADAGGYAANQPLIAAPDEVWAYSSGTTNIISDIVRDAIGGSFSDYLRFPQEHLFNKIGMRSPTMEVDASGTFVGSSFLYCSPRDWARYGQFLLQDGVWNGERILPEGWVDYMTTPTPAAPQGQYGAQTWLNAGSPGDPSDRDLPDVPSDMYYLSGYEGQRVFVVPSRDVVIVRMGMSTDYKAMDYNALVSQILDALEDNSSTD